jgi:hypothetical protein
MARKSLNEVIAALATAFPDNNTKFITPAGLRTFLDDFIKAIRPSYAILTRDAAVTQAVTTVDTPLVFTASDVTASLGEYTATPATGSITRVDGDGTSMFSFTTDVSSPSNSNRLLTFTLYKDGVASPFRQSQSFNVLGELISISFSAIQFKSTSATYSMRVQSSVNETFTFSNMVLVAQTVPVNSYT